MGQKVNPIGFRLGVKNSWDSLWYASKSDYAAKLHGDLKIKAVIKKELRHAGIASVKILRLSNNKTKVEFFTSKPGVAISKLDKLKIAFQNITKNEVSINVLEEKKPDANAVLVAQGIANQLEKRIAFRKAAKRSIQSAMKYAQGIKVLVSGRLAGAEIARSESYREGRVPLHTLRANIEYGFAEANTTYGIIGVKVWIYKANKQDLND